MPHALLARSLVLNQLYIHSKSAWVRLKQLIPNQNSYLAGSNLACSVLYHTQKNIRFIILKAYWVMLATFQKESTVTLQNLSLSLYLGFMDLFLLGTHNSFYSSSSHMKHSVLASVLLLSGSSSHLLTLYTVCSLKLQASLRSWTKSTSNKGSFVFRSLYFFTNTVKTFVLRSKCIPFNSITTFPLCSISNAC